MPKNIHGQWSKYIWSHDKKRFAIFECSQHAQEHIQKTCTIFLRAKQPSSSSPSLQPCLLKFKMKTSGNKKWRQLKPWWEDKRMVKLAFFYFFIFIPKLSFWDIYHINQCIHFSVHDHSSWSTFGLHLVMRSPKTL